MKLTQSFVNSLKPASKTIYVGDGAGLFLQVTPTGAKSWLFVYSAISPKTGKRVQREMGLGSFGGAGSIFTLTLAEARIAAKRASLQLVDGIDPIDARKVTKQPALAPVLFEDMLALTIKQDKRNWKVVDGVCGMEEDWNGKMNKHAAKLLKMPVANVTQQDVTDVVDPIWTVNSKTADRVRDIIKRVIETAKSNGKFDGPNPALKATIVGALGRQVKGKVKKQPSLSYVKVPAAIAKLLASGRMAAKASVFCTLTVTRSDEARLMQWSEIDWDAKQWTVPAERMKVETENDRGGAHLVPLSDAAFALLTEIKATRDLMNPFVFAGVKAGQPVAEGALNVVIAAPKAKGGILLLQGEATQHGMRASFRTWGKEVARIERDVLELCLAHLIGKDDTERAYDRAEMIEDRTKALQAWGEHCMATNLRTLQVAA